MMTKEDWIQLLTYSAITLFGVLARELKLKDITQLKITKFISEAIVAIFGALIIYFVVSMTPLPDQTGYIIAGLVGWKGNEVIDKIFERNVTLIDIKKEKKEE